MWSERTPGHPVRLLSRRLLPIVVLVRCCSVQDAASYTWPERVLLLDFVTTVVPIGHSRSTSSRGGVVSVFARGFKCTCDRWGLYRFYRVWKILSCGVLGLLKVSVSAMLATVRCSDIYCDIPTWVPRCRCYVSVTVEGCNRYGRDGYFTVY